MILYQYPSCTSCRKAIKFLQQQHLECELIDISLTPPTPAQLRSMLQAYHGQLKKLFNTSGQQYRQLAMKERWPQLSEEAALALLAANGMLVKRPFLLWQGGALLGFKEAEWRQQLEATAP